MPCPSVPTHPANANIKANITEAESHSAASVFNPAKLAVDAVNARWFYNQVRNKAFDDLWKRFHEKDGKNPCADFFGGIKNAEAAMQGLSGNVKVGPTKSAEADAQISGKTITIDPKKKFFDTSGFVNMQAGLDYSKNEVYVSAMTNIEAASFILAHELGHKTGKLKPDGDDVDTLGAASVENSGKIWQACFSDTGRAIEHIH